MTPATSVNIAIVGLEFGAQLEVAQYEPWP
jgi:hypothetical protein